VKLPGATHLVILCHRKAAEAQAQMAKMMEKLKLEVHQQKTRHVRSRLRQWLGRKHKIKGRVENQFPDDYLYQQLGVPGFALLLTDCAPWQASAGKLGP
jgi:hypothetical protein